MKKILGLGLFLLWSLFSAFVVPSPASATPTYGWAKTWGDPNDESYAYGASADSSGNVYVVGYFYGSGVDFDPGAGTDSHSAVGSTDAYVVKYDSDGNLLWARTWGSTGSDSANAVALDTSGNVYITGNFAGSALENVNFDGTGGIDNHVAYGNNSNLFVTKYNADGTYGWSQTLYGTANNKGQGIGVSTVGGVYVTGFFNGQVDFDPTGTTENHSNIANSKMFLTKYTTTGSYSWTKTLEGTGSAEGEALTVDSQDNAYVGGYFASTIDFDPTAGTESYTYATSGGYVTKYDSAGNYLWVKLQTGGGAGNLSTVYGLKADSDDNIYSTGRMTGTIDYDPGGGTVNHTSNGNEDFFLQKLDSDGNYVWSKLIGGTSFERGYGVTTDPSDNIYIGGYFSGIVDFDPGADTDSKTSTSDWDTTMFSTAYDSAGNYLWTRVTGSGQQSEANGITAYAYGVYLVGDAFGSVDFNPDGDGDIVPGATDYGSSALVKWVTAIPPSPSPTPSPSPLVTSTSTSNSSNSSPYVYPPAPLSFPVIYQGIATDVEITLIFFPGAGTVTTYGIFYGLTPNATDFSAYPLGDSHSREFSVKGLTPETTYFFRLTPFNGLTPGPSSPVFTLTTSAVGQPAVITTVPLPSPLPEPSFSPPSVSEPSPPASENESAPLPGVNNVAGVSIEILTRIGEVSAVAVDQLVIPATATVGVSLAIPATLSFASLLTSLLHIYTATDRKLYLLFFDLLVGIFRWLGVTLASAVFALFGIILKKKVKGGKVFDSRSGKGLGGAYVIAYSPSGNLSTDFTSVLGEYLLKPRPDRYLLRVDHSGYSYPSRHLDSLAGKYSSLYREGLEVEVERGDSISSFAIPLDSKVAHKFHRLQNLLARLSLPVSILWFVLTLGGALYAKSSFHLAVSALSFLLALGQLYKKRT